VNIRMQTGLCMETRGMICKEANEHFQVMNRHWILTLATIKVATVCLIFSLSRNSTAWATPGTKAAPEMEWILEQHDETIGDHTVYLSHDAIKLEQHKDQFVFLATSHDSKQYVFRPKEKIIATTSNFNWQNVFAIVETEKLRKYSIEDNVSWKGLRCRKLIQSEGNWTMVSKDIEIDPKLVKALCLYYNDPPFSAVPLATCRTNPTTKYKGGEWVGDGFHDLRAGSQLRFRTTNWKKVPYREEDFKKPVGFKSVPIRQVVMSFDKRSAVESMLDNVGFSDSLTPEKKKK